MELFLAMIKIQESIEYSYDNENEAYYFTLLEDLKKNDDLEIIF
jgi:hypothetical protein